MPECSNGFVDQLLAGLSGLSGEFDDVRPAISGIADRNRKVRQAWALVEVSRGIAPLSAFVSRWPDWDASKVLSDPEVTALIEEIGERPDLQSLAQQRLVAKTLDAALGVIAARLDPSDCGIHHARDVAELALKIDGAFAKGPKAVAAPRRRSFSLLGGVATVVSPEHPDGVGVLVRNAEGACRLFRAMRCVEMDEFHAVWECLKESLFVGSLTLEGW